MLDFSKDEKIIIITLVKLAEIKMLLSDEHTETSKEIINDLQNITKKILNTLEDK